MAYAYRKGLIKPHQYNGHYGEWWFPTDNALAKCAKMNDHYKEFQRLRAKKKDCGFCLIPGKIGKSCRCRWDLEQKMEKEERLGKDAKKQCDVQDRADEIAAEKAETEIYLRDDITVLPGAEIMADWSAAQNGAGAGVDDGAWDDGSTDIDDQNKKLMLYAGGAAAVLLVIIMMRRK